MRNNVRNLRENIHPLLVYYVNNKYIKLRCQYIVLVEKEVATHSSILAWEIVWTVEPGSLQSKG